MVQLAFMDRSGKISQTMTTWWKASYSALTCGASLAINCCAAWQLSSFLTLTQSLLLLFHTHCPVWCLISFTNPSYLLPLFPSSLTLSVAVSFSPSVAPVPFPPSCPAFYSAAPLTSAGIIPIMQSLCPDGQRDEFGFLQYKNSTWVGLFHSHLFICVLADLWEIRSLLLERTLRSVLLHMMAPVQRPLTPPRPSRFPALKLGLAAAEEAWITFVINVARMLQHYKFLFMLIVILDLKDHKRSIFSAEATCTTLFLCAGSKKSTYYRTRH